MATNKNTISLGDRYAEISVFAVTVIALLAGWFYKTGVENRSVAFELGNVSAALPMGWLRSEGEGANVVSVTDQTSAGFPTTYLLKHSEVTDDVTYALFAAAETRSLGEDLIAFRVLSQQQVLVNGRGAFEIKYVFVESDPNVTRQEWPAVVQGVEYIFLNAGQAVVVTYEAEKTEYEPGLAHFRRFLSSVKY